jgi:hypothetical protein
VSSGGCASCGGGFELSSSGGLDVSGGSLELSTGGFSLSVDRLELSGGGRDLSTGWSDPLQPAHAAVRLTRTDSTAAAERPERARGISGLVMVWNCYGSTSMAVLANAPRPPSLEATARQAL